MRQGNLCSFHFEIKSSQTFLEGGGGFAQSLGTPEWGRGEWGGTGSKVDGKGSSETREEQLGFLERGAEKEAARGRGAAGSSGADRALAREQPAGWARARPPRRAPARGAALRASGPTPRRPAAPSPQLPSSRGRAPRPSLGGNS